MGEGESPTDPERVPPYTIADAAWRSLFYPQTMGRSSVPSLTLFFLSALVTLVLVGITFAPGSGWKPFMVCLLTLLSWGIVVATLVITSALAGTTLTWKEASQMTCLAGMPVLLKLVNGCLFAVVTSVSPLRFTASPALISATVPFWMWRLDLFELWSAFTLYVILIQQGHSTRQAQRVTAIVWGVGAILLTLLWHIGGSL